MTFIIDVNSDSDVWHDLNIIAHTEVTPAEINRSLPFKLAEDHIITAIPSAALDQGGRSHPKRFKILLALEALYGCYVLDYGGRTSSGELARDTEATGEISSESTTEGPYSKTRSYHKGTTTTHVTSNRQAEVTVSDQRDNLCEQAVQILKDLGGDTTHIVDPGNEGFVVCLTPSRLKRYDRDDISTPTQDQSQQGTGELLPVEGELSYISDDDL